MYYTTDLYNNRSWKVPCGYFFINGLTASERANLIGVCIQRLSDVGIKVVSITCDGPSCHFNMLAELGASLKVTNMVPSFSHPLIANEKIFVLLDVCHMLKLMRNTLAEKGILFDSEKKQICWKYIKDLHNLQDAEGLRLGNKLKSQHIDWRQQKMKVNLAAQVFSSSVADAIEYGWTELKLPQFKGCEATVKFIRLIDQLFDHLNSRNPFAKGYKAALCISNKHIWNLFFDEAYRYIL